MKMPKHRSTVTYANGDKLLFEGPLPVLGLMPQGNAFKSYVDIKRILKTMEQDVLNVAYPDLVV